MYLIKKTDTAFHERASLFDRHLTEWIQPPMLRAPEVISARIGTTRLISGT